MAALTIEIENWYKQQRHIAELEAEVERLREAVSVADDVASALRHQANLAQNVNWQIELTDWAYRLETANRAALAPAAEGEEKE